MSKTLDKENLIEYIKLEREELIERRNKSKHYGEKNYLDGRLDALNLLEQHFGMQEEGHEAIK